MKKENIIINEIQAAYHKKQREFLDMRIAKGIYREVHDNELKLFSLLREGKAMAKEEKLPIDRKRKIAKLIIEEMKKIDSRCLYHWEV